MPHDNILFLHVIYFDQKRLLSILVPICLKEFLWKNVDLLIERENNYINKWIPVFLPFLYINSRLNMVIHSMVLYR